MLEDGPRAEAVLDVVELVVRCSWNSIPHGGVSVSIHRAGPCDVEGGSHMQACVAPHGRQQFMQPALVSQLIRIIGTKDGFLPARPWRGQPDTQFTLCSRKKPSLRSLLAPEEEPVRSARAQGVLILCARFILVDGRIQMHCDMVGATVWHLNCCLWVARPEPYGPTADWAKVIEVLRWPVTTGQEIARTLKPSSTFRAVCTLPSKIFPS
mmetsp:Transcript_50222/g.130739  ORF Transcript_50222/g.130739 Transcript_50222/m.130739 type:complete len:210 (+) Transcript_50222:154-783(+)